MQKFKIAVSKDQKKYTLVLDATSEGEAREKAHKQGYSILSVNTISEGDIQGQQFYFEGTLGGEHKRGKVIWNDIFKLYLKLRQDLGYHISSIYSESDKGIGAEQKAKIIRDLESSYDLYLGIKVKKEIESKTQAPESELDGFYMKKELEETYGLIDLVLKKLENIIGEYQFYGLDDLGLEKIKNIHNSIVKIQKTTNISKLKEIGENALIKIGTIELRSIEKDKNIEQRDLLKLTNDALKQIGSNQRFIEQNKDIKKIISHLFEEAKTSIVSVWEWFKPEKIEKLDKGSYSYVKTKVLKQKYQGRAKLNLKNILKNFQVFLFPFGKNKELKDDLSIKRRVISQNISLLDAKLSWKVYSYVKVVKWYRKVIDFILWLFFYLKDSLFLVIFLYSVVFLIYIIAGQMFSLSLALNFNGLFYFIVAALLYFVILLSRWVMSLLINFVFLFFIVIFAVVNF